VVVRLKEIDERLKRIETYLWNEKVHQGAIQKQENTKYLIFGIIGIVGLLLLITAGKREKAGEYLVKKSLEWI